MNNCGEKVVDQLIKVTTNNPDFKEVPITEEVSEILKKKKEGLFQNEVDYKVLFPAFMPPQDEGNSKDRYRGDLVGFSNGGFSLIEFKIYDENRKNKNNWGVFWYFNQDRLKIESARKANNKKLYGTGAIVFAVRNTDFKTNEDQVKLMAVKFGTLQSNERYPGIKNANYYSILEAYKEYCMKNSSFPWKFDEIIKKDNVAFLVGRIELF